MNADQITDPVERVIAHALTNAEISFTHEVEPVRCESKKDPREFSYIYPDFYLPDYRIFIECKRFYSSRALRTLRHCERVILIQSLEAAQAFAHLIDARNRAPLKL